MNELNYLLTDLKDRLTVLEVNQNINQNQMRNYINKNNDINRNNRNILNMGNNPYTGNMNEKILLSMETILKRIDKLEEANYKKAEKINLLKEKIKVYEPTITATSDNDSINDNNSFNFNKNKYNYNFNNNINDYKNNNDQNSNYINLGSIKNNDTSTITSTNSYMKSGLLEIKEELNNPSPKKKTNKKNKEKKFPSEDSYQFKKDDELNTLEKNLKEKEKAKKIQNNPKNKVHKKDINEFPNTKKKKGKEKKEIKNKKEEIINNDINNRYGICIKSSTMTNRKKQKFVKGASPQI